MKAKMTSIGGPFAVLAAYCRARNYPPPEAEYRFAKPRRFAFDAAWIDELVAMEVEGGMFGKGKPCPVCHRRPAAGHTSVERLKSDLEKYNLAAVLGWMVLRVRPEQIESGEAFSLLDSVLGG